MEETRGYDTVKILEGGFIEHMQGRWEPVPYEPQTFFAGTTGKLMRLVGPAIIGGPPTDNEPGCWMDEDSRRVEVPSGERVWVVSHHPVSSPEQKAHMSVVPGPRNTYIDRTRLRKTLLSRMDAPTLILHLRGGGVDVWQDPLEPPWIIHIDGANGAILLRPVKGTGARFPLWEADAPSWLPPGLDLHDVDVLVDALALTISSPELGMG